MTQKSFFWNGASVGDADTWTRGGGYHMANIDYESPFVDIVCRALFGSTGNRGPLKGWLNELAVSGVATPVSVNTGAALIYGLYYENDAALNVVVPDSTYDTRIDRIVVRRNWTTQTARITRIAGTEGGGAPALTQSAAPDGTGIYDIPLARLSVAPAIAPATSVIAVTDEREFCQFSTGAGANSVDTADIPADTVDDAARDQVAKNLIFGWSELLPLVSSFSYTSSAVMTGAIAASWGAAAASMEGWRCSGSGTGQARNFYVVFKVPADYVPGTTILPIVWWIDDWTGATTITFYSCWQTNRPSSTVTFSESRTTTNVTETSVVDTVHSTALMPISDLVGDEMILFAVQYYNSAGSELELVTGLEFTYTGYV